MEQTIANINKTKSWFFEKVNKLKNPQPDSSRKKGRGHKSIKLEMKEMLQPITEKYKRS